MLAVWPSAMRVPSQTAGTSLLKPDSTPLQNKIKLSASLRAGSSIIKTFAINFEEVALKSKHVTEWPPSISGKVGHDLISIVLGCSILIDFLLLGCFCQPIYLLDVAICSIH